MTAGWRAGSADPLGPLAIIASRGLVLRLPDQRRDAEETAHDHQDRPDADHPGGVPSFAADPVADQLEPDEGVGGGKERGEAHVGERNRALLGGDCALYLLA